ncbi:MAG: thiamine-phosphate synthase family protein [Promethearchaeota archaeon]
MKPPCESVVRTYLKTLRTAVARELRDKYQFKQQEIATALDLTQAAISMILSRPIPPEDSLEAELFPVVEGLAGEVSREINSNRENLESGAFKHGVLEKTCFLCRELRLVGGVACGIHKRENPHLRDAGCEICSTGWPATSSKVDERTEVLGALASAVERVSKLPGFARLIPEVQSNLLLGIPDAKEPHDVAAFPGRIIRVKDRVEVLSEPEFGASTYISRILLAVRETFPEKACCVCLRYDEDVKAALVRSGLEVVTLEFSEQSTVLRDEIAGLLREEKPVKMDVLVNLGGRGTEPLVYLFDVDLDGLIEKVQRLLDSFS